MIVMCEKCHTRFDDEFRLTICPHPTFAANDGHNNFAHHPESFIETLPTKQRLAQVLRSAGAPSQMVDRAAAGAYDDYESESATPIMNLVRDLQLVGLHDLSQRAMAGEFDGTREEAAAYFRRQDERRN